MLLLPKALQVVKAASKDETRFALCGIRIEPDGATVATNGHILARFRPTMHPDPKEYPAVEGCSAVDPDGAALAPFTIPSESVNALLKALPKQKGRVLPILNHIALDVAETNRNGHAVCATTDLENPQVIRPRKIDADFPTYQNVYPKGKPQMVIGFALAAFRDALDTLKATGVEFFVMEVRVYLARADDLRVLKVRGRAYRVSVPIRFGNVKRDVIQNRQNPAFLLGQCL